MFSVLDFSVPDCSVKKYGDKCVTDYDCLIMCLSIDMTDHLTCIIFHRQKSPQSFPVTLYTQVLLYLYDNAVLTEQVDTAEI